MPLTPDNLKAAGFKYSRQTSYKPYPTDLYQKRIRDEHGTRYFIDVWHHDQLDFDNGTTYPRSFEVEVNYNDGCTFHPAACIRLKCWSCNEWEVSDVESFAAELWNRLRPNYYERND